MQKRAAQSGCPQTAKNFCFEPVGGDAHIAPREKLAILPVFLQICNIFGRADVGIGPYDNFFDMLRAARRAAITFL